MNENLITARNNSFESMLKAQSMMDHAVSPFQKDEAECLYELSWAIYQIINYLEKKERKEALLTQTNKTEGGSHID